MQIPIRDASLSSVIDQSSSPLDRVTSGGYGESSDTNEPKAITENMTLSRAAHVETLMAAANSFGGIRQDRVDYYRQSIQTGEYKVNASEIADAMMSDFRI